MKLKFFVWNILLVTIFSSFSVVAQNTTVSAPVVEGLKATLSKETQNAETKEIKFKMTLNSNVDSDRVRIRWNLKTLSGNGARFNNTSDSLIPRFTVKKGSTYEFIIAITPLGKGEFEIMGEAESFKANETFKVSVKEVLQTNNDGEIIPFTSEYQTSRMLLLIRNVVIIFLLAIALIFGGLFGFKKFRNWLNSN